MDLIFSLLLSVFLMSVAWQLYNWTGNHNIADALRPFNIFLIGSCHLFLQGWHHTSSLAFYLLALWACRLGLFMFFTRVMSKHNDHRYSALIESWQSSDEKFIKFYMVQGLYIWLLSLPFYFIAKQVSYNYLDIFLLIFIGAAIMAETIADFNLHHFIKRNESGIYRDGFWDYCRHPNYFFEWLVWLGFSCLGVYNISSLMSLFTCVFLFLVIRFYLIPISEKFLIGIKGQAYIDYQAEVPAFFPFKI